MSLNKTLDRLFDEIRREAKRNPDFANRLDAIVRVHDSRRDVPDEIVADIADEAPCLSSPASGGGGREAVGGGKRRRPLSQPVAQPDSSTASGGAKEQTPGINPAGLYKREGEEALRTALDSQELSALRALVSEHNLDPSGVTPSLTHDELAAHIIAQAKRRAERDDKMFDY